MLWEILYATASASMCALGLEMWHSMNTNSLWLMGWTGFIRPMNIKRIVWPFLPLPLDHLHKNKTKRIPKNHVCFTLSWTGEGSCSCCQFYIYFLLWKLLLLFWVSHQILSRTVGHMWHAKIRPLFLLLSKKKCLDCVYKCAWQKLNGCGWRLDFKGLFKSVLQVKRPDGL